MNLNIMINKQGTQASLHPATRQAFHTVIFARFPSAPRERKSNEQALFKSLLESIMLVFPKKWNQVTVMLIIVMARNIISMGKDYMDSSYGEVNYLQGTSGANWFFLTQACTLSTTGSISANQKQTKKITTVLRLLVLNLLLSNVDIKWCHLIGISILLGKILFFSLADYCLICLQNSCWSQFHLCCHCCFLHSIGTHTRANVLTVCIPESKYMCSNPDYVTWQVTYSLGSMFNSSFLESKVSSTSLTGISES